MPEPLSNDLRRRLVECVEAGSSRRAAAARFQTAASSAVNVVKLWKETGSIEPRPRGGFRHGKLKPHRAFILSLVESQPDITMPELAAELLEHFHAYWNRGFSYGRFGDSLFMLIRHGDLRWEWPILKICVNVF